MYSMEDIQTKPWIIHSNELDLDALDEAKKHAGSKTTDTVYKIYLNSPEMHTL